MASLTIVYLVIWNTTKIKKLNSFIGESYSVYFIWNTTKIKKLNYFIGESYSVYLVWNTTKIKKLNSFRLLAKIKKLIYFIWV